MSGATPGGIVLTAHTFGLAVGRYETELVITSGAGVSGSPQTIPVTLIVAEEVHSTYLPIALNREQGVSP